MSDANLLSIVDPRAIPGANRYKKKYQSCYEDVLDFCNIANLHLEPSLKTCKSSLYHASNVLQTRVIDVNPLSAQLQANLSPDELRTFDKVKNQDCVKQEWRLDQAERFHLKCCFFVHALRPSVFLKMQQNIHYAKRQRIFNQLKLETSPKIRDSLKKELELLNCEGIQNHFTKTDFLHYRFWFFDLDYKEYVEEGSLFEMMESTGLTPYVNAIVQTSPTKYHFYMKSEMIATRAQVMNWPSPLSMEDLEMAVDAGYLKSIYDENPRYTGSEWHKVAKRGIPSISRLADIPIPIPEEAELANGFYCGDDKVHADFQDTWRRMAAFFGADTSTNDPLRIAQLPGYSNPKNLYQSHLIYQNKDARVLTTKAARSLADKMENVMQSEYGGKSFYDAAPKAVLNENHFSRIHAAKGPIDPSSSRFTGGLDFLKSLEDESGRKIRRKESRDKYNKKRKERRAESKKKKKSKKKYVKLRDMPQSPEDYCRRHGLMDEVVWSENISGHSNRMLLALCRYVKKYINLADSKQRDIYFDAIIRPYFESRTSKDLKKDKNLANFKKRFEIICNSGLKDLEKFLSEKCKEVVQGINIKNVKVLFEERVSANLGRASEVFRQIGHAKLRKIIYDSIARSGFARLKDGKVEIEFYIPHKVMHENVGGKYRNLLRVYENIDVYRVDSRYKCPVVDDYGNVYKKGVCKRHLLYLEDCDINSVLGNQVALRKRRLTKAEQREENSKLLQKVQMRRGDPGGGSDL